MFCSNCGAQLQDNAKFCENCGCAIANDNINTSPANSNPYASAPVQNTYAQPQNTYYTPQAPAEPTYQPQQNFPNTPPQYLRPVQTPTGVQYVPAEMPVAAVKKPATYNPFVFISAAIMGLTFFLIIMPWFTANGEGFNLFKIFSDNIYLERFEMDAMALCSFLMLITMGLLIPSIIFALIRKNQMPIGFAIAASVITLVTLLFFVALLSDSKGNVAATSVPAIMFLLSVANIIFPIIARKVGR